MANASKLMKLTDEDLAMRKAILNNDGYLVRAAEELGWSKYKIYNRVQRKRHRLWWLRLKRKNQILRKRKRERNWYKSAIKKAGKRQLHLEE